MATDGGENETVPDWVGDEAAYWRTKYESKEEQYQELKNQYQHMQREFTTTRMTSGPGAGSVVNQNPDPGKLFTSLAQYIQVFLAVIGGVVFVSGFIVPLSISVQVIGGAVGIGSLATFSYHEWKEQPDDDESAGETELRTDLPPAVAEHLKNQE
ncbi:MULTISPECIES: hypothetical protein [Haloferax]|uniref:hypothetical protein n=1 Tax=Haloferax TaxID=2251 RepID=UPI0011C02D55|nr:hypothetical protein [Haloferax sp. Atlit-4N]